MSPTCRSIVYLEIDNRQCVQSSSQCFQSATDVAAFLGALASLGNLNIPYKIEAVKSECPPPASPPRAQFQGESAWEGGRPRRACCLCHLPPTGGCALPSRVRGALFRNSLPGTRSRLQ